MYKCRVMQFEGTNPICSFWDLSVTSGVLHSPDVTPLDLSTSGIRSQCIFRASLTRLPHDKSLVYLLPP